MSAVKGIRAVAARAGVSISTVSRVLAGGYASEKSVDAVAAAAHALNYHPDPVASAMRTKAPVAEMAFEHGAETERAAIVAWLRRQLVGGYPIVPIADAIERGEHRK